MSSVIPKGGPCYLKHWPCHETRLPCYRDCCQRGTQFCNHREERCQDCTLREQECGNWTMPYECDAFCLRKTDPVCIKNVDVDVVPAAYMYITYVLATVVLGLSVSLGFTCWSKRCRRQQQRPNPAVSDSIGSDIEKASLIESTISSSSTENKQVQTEDHLVSVPPRNPTQPRMNCGEQATPLTSEMTPPCGRKGELPGFNPAYEQTFPLTRETSRPFGQDARPPNAAHVNPTSESQGMDPNTTHVNAAMGSLGSSDEAYASYSARECQDRGRPAIGMPGGAPQPPAASSSHPCPRNGGECHDPHLDNIPPTDDANRDVSVALTRQAPLGQGVNYGSDG